MKATFSMMLLLTLVSCNQEIPDDKASGLSEIKACEIPFPPAGGIYKESDFLQTCSLETLVGTWRIAQLKCSNNYVDLCDGNIYSIRTALNNSLDSVTTTVHSTSCTYSINSTNIFAATSSVITTQHTQESCTNNSECSKFCNGISTAIEAYDCKSNGTNVIFMKAANSDLCNGAATEQVLIKL